MTSAYFSFQIQAARSLLSFSSSFDGVTLGWIVRALLLFHGK